MRIVQTDRVDRTRAKARPGAAGDSAAATAFVGLFDAALETPTSGPPAPAAGLGAAAGAGALGAMLGLGLTPVDAQPEQAERQAADRGHRILDHLEALRLDLLTGRLSRDRLERLTGDLAEAAAGSLSPALADLVAEIDLLAQVELAKLERLTAMR